MKAIGYVRVSTNEQATEGSSLENQVEKIRQYCQLKDLKLTGIIKDAGQSAKDLNRPGIQRIIEECLERKFDMVIVYKLDRLTRKVRDLGYLIEDIFEKNGIKFASIKDSFDTSTANGKMFMNILGTVAQWERDIISERTKDVLQMKIQNGIKLGPPAYGIRLDEKSKELVGNPNEQAVLDTIRELRSKGQTLKAIAATLNAKGFKTRHGNPWKHQNISYLLKDAA